MEGELARWVMGRGRGRGSAGGKERVGDGWVVRDEEEGGGERTKLKGREEEGGGKGLGEVRSGAWRMNGGGLLDLEWIQGFLLHLLVS